MIKAHKFKVGETVYFRENDEIISAKVLSKGTATVNLQEAENDKFQKLPNGTIYFLHGYPGKQFKEEDLKDSPEYFLKA